MVPQIGELTTEDCRVTRIATGTQIINALSTLSIAGMTGWALFFSPLPEKVEEISDRLSITQGTVLYVNGIRCEIDRYEVTADHRDGSIRFKCPF